MGFSEDSLHIDRVVCLLINYPRDVITGSLPGFLMGFKEKKKCSFRFNLFYLYILYIILLKHKCDRLIKVFSNLFYTRLLNINNNRHLCVLYKYCNH